VGDPTFEHHDEPPAVQPSAESLPVQARGRGPLERAILVPVGAALLALEQLLGVASALVDAEKAGRELLHFEERGIRARSHVEGLVHHHRHRAADNLEQRIEQTRTHVNKLATKSHSITSKIRPHMPKY
jgi:predicted component of type VI protein secretion system